MTHKEIPALWEERSANPVIEAGRDQLLKRSRQLVEAAYELLDEEGLEGLTIRAVLRKTGLSRRAFYERFADKDELVLAVFEQSIRLATEHYSEQISNITDPVERLKLILTWIVLGSSAAGDATAASRKRRGAAMSREHLRLAQTRGDDLQAALAPLNYANLDTLPQFEGVVTTTEFLCKHIFDQIVAAAHAGRLGPGSAGLQRVKVTLNESHVARAWYEGAL